MEKSISQLISSINLSQMGGKDYSQLNPASDLPAEVNQQVPNVTRRESNTPVDTIKKAWRSKLIGEASDKEIAQRLSLIYFMIGLRPQHFPTKEEDYIIFSYLRSKYPYRTLDELYLAFDLAINNELDLEEVKVYDQFSIEYLVRIMYGYARYVYSKMKDEKKPPTTPEDIKLSEEEKLQDVNDFLNSGDNEYKIVPLYLYDFMVELNLLEYTEEETIRLYKKAILTRKHEYEIEIIRNAADRIARSELERLKENIRENFRNASSREYGAIYVIYKRIVLLDQREKRRASNKEKNKS